jgi:hypothetical protein
LDQAIFSKLALMNGHDTVIPVDILKAEFGSFAYAQTQSVTQ